MMKRAAGRNSKPDTAIREYAAGQTSDLLRRTAFQASRASVLKHADSIHDLRVSIRRLTQCLRAFEQLLPQDKVQKVRQRLKAVLDLASEVRDRDIALGLLRRAALPSGSPLLKALAEERAHRAQALVEELRLWSKKNIQKKWRSRLGL
jgi:CHAD domain-containing protein